MQLSTDEVSDWIASNPAWTTDGQFIERELVFESFRTAFAFMTHMAMVAERLNHHPEWSNVYNRVQMRLTTHDAGGLTQVDLTFAAEVDAAVGFEPNSH